MMESNDSNRWLIAITGGAKVIKGRTSVVVLPHTRFVNECCSIVLIATRYLHFYAIRIGDGWTANPKIFSSDNDYEKCPFELLITYISYRSAYPFGEKPKTQINKNNELNTKSETDFPFDQWIVQEFQQKK